MDGTVLSARDLRVAVADLDADVVSLQEVDVGQPRSHQAHQARLAAQSLGARHWGFAPALAGTPGPARRWHPVATTVITADLPPAPLPLFGVALVSRVPVRSWHVLALGAGRARLPVQAPEPGTGRSRWWWVPDEPRVALAAELDDVTVVATHLSFSPPTAVRQLLRLGRWASGLPGHVVVAGDLNLPGSLPARLVGRQRLVEQPTYPAAAPRLQLDHIVAGRHVRASQVEVRRLHVGDHLAAVATLLAGV